METFPKPILYIDMDNVLVDFQSGINRLDAITRQQYEGRLDEVPGIFALMDPLPGAVEAFHQLSERYDTYILSTAPWENPSAWSDKLQWVKQHLGKAAYKRLILSHHKNLNTGDILIDDRPKNGAAQFKGELILFGSDQYPDWKTILHYLGISTDGDDDQQEEYFQYPISVKCLISSGKDTAKVEAETSFSYDFSEIDLRVLSKFLSTYNADDDVAEILEYEFCNLFDDLYKRAVAFAQGQAVFCGQAKDLIYDLYEYYAYSPMDLVEADIKNGVLTPSNPSGQQLPEKELIAQWCRLHQKDLEQQTFAHISSFLKQQYQIDCNFGIYYDFEMRFPETFYTQITKIPPYPHY